MRNLSVDLSGTCTSAEDGRLLRIADVANALKGLKPDDPSKVLVSVIAGPTAPYRVQLGLPVLADDPNQWPSIEHSCVNAAVGINADPGIRLSGLAEAFGGNGLFTSACSGGAQSSLQRLAESIGVRPGYACLERIPRTAAGRPDCTAVDHFVAENGARSDVPLPYCQDAGAGTACWDLNRAASSCRALVAFERPTMGPGRLTSTTFTCASCQPNDARPGCSSL
jgi:hypothetical protein